MEFYISTYHLKVCNIVFLRKSHFVDWRFTPAVPAPSRNGGPSRPKSSESQDDWHIAQPGWWASLWDKNCFSILCRIMYVYHVVYIYIYMCLWNDIDLDISRLMYAWWCGNHTAYTFWCLGLGVRAVVGPSVAPGFSELDSIDMEDSKAMDTKAHPHYPPFCRR